MNELFYLSPIVGILALASAWRLSRWIEAKDSGTERMRQIASFIREGAMAFLFREYRVIFFFIAVMFALLAFAINPGTACTFLLGALFSLIAGFLGMRTATSANVRTTAAAAQGGLSPALKIAFRGGSVMGLCVVGLGILGVGALSAALGEENIAMLTGFGLGASSIALFGRVGGGIYTKAADVGADLVGKVEAGIPEDDPRNPAVIADNVGDNVGDVAGMGSDLFESYVGAIISSILLAFALPHISPVNGSLFPLILSSVGILVAIASVFVVGAGQTSDPAKSLNRCTYISGFLSIVAAYFLSQAMFGGLYAFWPVMTGLVIGIAIGANTEYYTSAEYKYVRGIAKQCETGSATCIIDGLSVGMLSTVTPVVLIAAGIIVSYYSAGLYGIALAAVGMLSTAAVTIAIDAYGPISDNAGGIAEMSNLPKNVRDITNKLDSVGNITAAIGKGFAIASAALTALALFVSYTEIANIAKIDLLDPMVVSGLLLGAMLPFLFTALTMKSVGRAAFSMIAEVRRQFKEHPGIMAGTDRPDYAKCVDISTSAALKEMVLPGLIAVASPILVGLALGVEALGGLLAGALASGVLLAIMMANAGGAWDNAKKYIEEGFHGGKGSEAHKAAVVGDTVGDPFKDTSGPSINILIKLMTIVAVVFVPLFLQR